MAKDYFDKMNRKIDNFYKHCLEAYIELRGVYVEDTYVRETNMLTKKDYAMWIMNNYSDISNLLFDCLKNKNLEPNYEEKWVISEWWDNLNISKKLEYINNMEV